MKQLRIASISAALVSMALILFAGGGVGCIVAKPPIRATGFLSDYSKIKLVNQEKMNYVSPEVKNYNAYILDKVDFLMDAKKLSEEDRGKVTEHFRTKLTKMLTQRGLTLTQTPGQGVARIRIALTAVTDATWNLGSAGGAGMEAEIVDSVSGKQLAAVIQASPGDALNLASTSTVDDIKNVIDKWVEQAGKGFDEMGVGKK